MFNNLSWPIECKFWGKFKTTKKATYEVYSLILNCELLQGLICTMIQRKLMKKKMLNSSYVPLSQVPRDLADSTSTIAEAKKEWH